MAIIPLFTKVSHLKEVIRKLMKLKKLKDECPAS